MKPLSFLMLAAILLPLLGRNPNAAAQRGTPESPSVHLASRSGAAPEDVLSRGNQLEMRGQFKEAAALFGRSLSGTDLSVSQRKALEFELDRLERIKKCYPYSQAGLLDALRKSVAGLANEEYEHWVEKGRFDTRQIDGEQCFMGSSVRNLFFRYPELRSRRQPPEDSAELEKRYRESCRLVKTNAVEQKAPYVLPKRFRATMTIEAADGAAPAGEVVRAWLPLPRRYPYQTDFKLVSASPAATHIADGESTIRCVYIENRDRANHPAKFKIEYEYTRFAVWFDINPDAVRPSDTQEPALGEFVREGAHVEFTPEMRARQLSRQIVGRETNSFRKAKLIYDWIADRIKYSYSVEYSTIRNLSEYCRTKGYGDCGQEALLFITLCRLNRIPARWQSGWNIFPGAKDIHDWSEIYLAPYGWVPVDPYMGVFAMQYVTTLSSAQRRELRDFYFGGMDQYRMAANSDHCQTLTPPKQSMRSDTVDFQRGELEYGSHNVYFDQYSYELAVKELEPAASSAGK